MACNISQRRRHVTQPQHWTKDAHCDGATRARAGLHVVSFLPRKSMERIAAKFLILIKNHPAPESARRELRGPGFRIVEEGISADGSGAVICVSCRVHGMLSIRASSVINTPSRSSTI